jgi:hypothetical protein
MPSPSSPASLSNTYAAELSDDTRNSATAKENCGLARDFHIIGME